MEISISSETSLNRLLILLFRCLFLFSTDGKKSFAREVRWGANNYRWLKIISISPRSREKWLRPRTCAILNVDHTRYNYNLTSIALQQHWFRPKKCEEVSMFFSPLCRRWFAACDRHKRDIQHDEGATTVYEPVLRWMKRTTSEEEIYLAQSAVVVIVECFFFSSPRRALRQLAEVEKNVRQGEQGKVLLYQSSRGARLVWSLTRDSFSRHTYNYDWKAHKVKSRKVVIFIRWTSFTVPRTKSI